MRNGKRYFYVFLFIAVCHFWNGCEYTSWFYALSEYFPETYCNLLSQGVNCLLVSGGIFLFALFMHYSPTQCICRGYFALVCLTNISCTFIYMFVPSCPVVIIAGLFRSVTSGYVAGYYLTKLAMLISQQSKATVFGTAYGVGSLATWLVSLIGENDSFLSTKQSFAVLCAAAVLAVLVNSLLLSRISDEKPQSSEMLRLGNRQGLHINIFLIISAAVLMLSLVKSFTFFFPSNVYINGTVDMEFSRLFFAAGLICAGIVNDHNRKLGLVCCLVSLVFPFLTFFAGTGGTGFALWIIGYFFSGFYTVYRTILFSDVSQKSATLLPLAGFGLALGRLGDSLGSICGIGADCDKGLLLILSVLLFVALIPVCFLMYRRLYVQHRREEKPLTDKLRRFESQFDLSDREKDVFILMLSGRSNKDLAGDLYIAESTVKFHVKNILKKAQCRNRLELCDKFREFC